MSTAPISSDSFDKFQTIYPGRSQQVSFNATSALSSTLQSNTTLIKLFATQNCWVRLTSTQGHNPVAAANDGFSFYVPGGFIDFFGVYPGTKLAVIQDSTSGTLYILEAAKDDKNICL